MKLKTIFKTAKWYLASSFITKLFVFFQLSLLAKNITPSDMGVIDSLSSISQLLMLFISLHLDAAIARIYHFKKNDFDKLSEFFSTNFLFILAYGVTVLIFVHLMASESIATFLKTEKYLVFFSFSPILFIQLNNLLIVLLKQQLKSKIIFRLDLIQSIITTSVMTGIIFWTEIDLYSKFIGMLIAQFILLLITIYLTFTQRLLRFRFSKTILYESLLYSIPLLPNMVGGWVHDLSDRLVIGKYFSMKMVGIYAIANQVAKIVYILQDVFTKILGPQELSILVEDYDKGKKLAIFMATKFFALFSLFHIIIALFSNEIVLLISTKEYLFSFHLIAILSYSFVVASLYRLYLPFLQYKKKLWIVSCAGIGSAILNLLLNIKYVPVYGIWAASFSTVFSFIFYTFFIISYVEKKYKVDFPIRSIIEIFSVELFFYFLSTIYFDSIIYRVGIILSFLGVLKWRRYIQF
ncbi:MAG: oligosaccharide flippase family protein [Halobacteriovoraceae bacterium]|nr:oligosaccharide flippase family protein [Halobacteriovoraceae bacterium]